MLENIINNSTQLLENIKELHPSDISKSLIKIYKDNSDEFYTTLPLIPKDILGEVLLELPENIRDKAYSSLSIEKLVDAVEAVETDDATDIIQDIEDIDKAKSISILSNLEKEDQEDIAWLKRYDEEEAGAFMQTELFSAKLNEPIKDAIHRLKTAKENNELENIHQVFLIDENQTLITSISLEDLIIVDFNITFQELLDNNPSHQKSFHIKADDHIDEVIKLFEQYDLSVVAVTGYQNRLIGRITSDDIIDEIEKNATEQMYQLAGVDEHSQYDDDIITTTKHRGTWLFINLFTAIAASLTIGLFDEILTQYIALAILMPIVASMGGNAGTQTLAVMVRQLALGTIDLENSKEAIKKEVSVALINGFTFAVIMGSIASIWFNTNLLGIVIALSMIINILIAGLFGTLIPLILKKFEIDPAIGSTVILTTITDIVGFFSFLGLASLIL
ncbi:MAG: magnesium transporter [Campylobacteraceae bacterium]|jgi:magnesium transporter|nr:magnesium transporter [Campylobacteraceae bacterium]MBT3882018.1 magnesium transporter [Campylobacteraceae bacterium]MBT4029980.1 magnesium transporter [Campylobacteraceae bacterium]MBT4179940.1 magnesium transporter [Campylobacteraceae bacterium]MBT4572244.1 magnesium transporter [Campylobacteraceae bacterium]